MSNHLRWVPRRQARLMMTGKAFVVCRVKMTSMEFKLEFHLQSLACRDPKRTDINRNEPRSQNYNYGMTSKLVVSFVPHIELLQPVNHLP